MKGMRPPCPSGTRLREPPLDSTAASYKPRPPGLTAQAEDYLCSLPRCPQLLDLWRQLGFARLDGCVDILHSAADLLQGGALVLIDGCSCCRHSLQSRLQVETQSVASDCGQCLVEVLSQQPLLCGLMLLTHVSA